MDNWSGVVGKISIDERSDGTDVAQCKRRSIFQEREACLIAAQKSAAEHEGFLRAEK